MSEITGGSVVRPHSSVAHRVVDGTALIVLPQDAKMLTLNEVGSSIWNLLGERTVDQIAEQLVEEYEVTMEQALNDVVEFLTMLHEREIVKIEEK